MVVASVLELDELNTIEVGTLDIVVEEFAFDAKNDIVKNNFATPKPTLTDVAYGIQRKKHTDWNWAITINNAETLAR
jgi:hypothetical protein